MRTDYINFDHILTGVPYSIWINEDIPLPADVGNNQLTPFTVTICANDIYPHVIDLYAQYSHSSPLQTDNKWGHLIPQWKFKDLSGNYIDQITTIDTVISDGNEVIGVTGYAQYYFVDDMSSRSKDPIIIWNTMEVSGLQLSSESHNGILPVPSYANSKIVAYKPVEINGMMPSYLEITRNGIDPLSTGIYWEDKKIPIMITVNGDSFCYQNAVNTIFFDYPANNEIGLQNIITKQITTINISGQNWSCLDTNTASAYFLQYDNQGFKSGGYSRNVVIPNTSSLNTNITAQANVFYPASAIYKSTPYMWLSDPDNNKLHRIRYHYLDQTIKNNINNWLEQQSKVKNLYITDTEYISTQINVMQLTGFGGIYGIAVDPCYNVWMTDSELDKLFKYDSDGILLTSVNLGENSSLSTYGITGGCTPAGISLDKNYNLWVTLFDSSSVLKFDSDGNYQLSIDPGGLQTAQIDGLGFDPDYKPCLAETDKDSNLWVTYSNPISSYIKKYSDTGVQLSSIMLPTSSTPTDIIIDYDNNVWVSLSWNYAYPPLNGQLRKYSNSTGILLSSIIVQHPGYMTLDLQNNIWFTCELNTMKKLDTTTGGISSWEIGSLNTELWYNSAERQEYNCLEGIACDSHNRIWVINSYENKMYVYNNEALEWVNYFPTDRTEWVINTDLTISAIDNDKWANSLQAFGDWSGLRWIQKYFSGNHNLTGESGNFDINGYNIDIRKFNESFDTTSRIQSYALVERIRDNDKLFQDYIGTMVGGLETSADSMGRKIYEKIANFTQNNIDIDTCELNQIYSLAEEVNVPIDDYTFQYPEYMKRLMGIISVNHKKLWGDRCKCRNNYFSMNTPCKVCGHFHITNRGEPLDTDTYITTAGIPFLAEYRYDRNNFELVTPISGGLNVAQAVSSVLYNTDISYCYYEYIPTLCNVQDEGIINWQDPYTTLNEAESSLSAWYGNLQLVEKMLNYQLREGLKF